MDKFQLLQRNTDKLNNPWQYPAMIWLIILFFYPTNSQANFVSGPYFVTEKYFDFTKSLLPKVCKGRTPYPVLSNEDQELTTEINDEIYDFVELYSICNQGSSSNFSVKFDMPNSGTNDYFSVRWITKKDNKIYRIDSLNFDINNGDLLSAQDIFNPFSSTLLKEIVRLSEGHLPSHFTWENFLDKINQREIQYYLKNKQWYIVFNSSAKLDKIVEAVIPKYFLKRE